jgi:8-oxo-dGTP pyrophosphatase MutT (NUDIX family)
MYRAGLILYHPDNDAILLIRDSRSHMWSFPKGGRERCDSSQLRTAVREVREETGFIENADYHVFLGEDILDIQGYVFFQGLATRTELYMTENLREHVANIEWVPFDRLRSLRLNHVTYTALRRLGLLVR